MFGPENTGERDPMLHLLGAMSDGSEKYITDMESAGQKQLVNSDRLPVEVESSDGDAPFLALGFTFGAPDPSDKLFRPATLPAGWSRQASDHSMHSSIVDEHGRERVNIFYKAAFYDRRASMYLNTVTGYLRSCIWHDTKPVLDDKWLTHEIADAELARLRDSELAEAAECDEKAKANSYWVTRAAEHRADAAKVEAMRLVVSQ